MNSNFKEKRNYLHLFNVVISNGTKDNGTYHLEGIIARHDFDGYTCWLEYNDLTITLLFHNKYEFDYRKEETVERFFKKVDRLLSKY